MINARNKTKRRLGNSRSSRAHVHEAGYNLKGLGRAAEKAVTVWLRQSGCKVSEDRRAGEPDIAMKAGNGRSGDHDVAPEKSRDAAKMIGRMVLQAEENVIQNAATD